VDAFWTWLPLAVIVVVAVLAIRRFGMPPWWMWGGHDGGSGGTGSGNGADERGFAEQGELPGK
jgi:hypothetical protein